jgi:hypothetical protein
LNNGAVAHENHEMKHKKTAAAQPQMTTACSACCTPEERIRLKEQPVGT